MASIINASTSSGIVQTADTSGVLQLQTASTTAITVDASQNVGIGVTPSAWGTSYGALELGNTTNSVTSGLSTVAGAFNAVNNAYYNGTNWKYKVSYNATRYFGGDGIHTWSTAASGTAGNNITWSESMRIDSSGRLLIGTTSTTPNPGIGLSPNETGVGYISIGHTTAASSGDWYANFYYHGTSIGKITQNGTTGVTYGTTSDYRLKENVTPMLGALDKISKLNPVTYKWKSDGLDGQGFIAHELQVHFPDAVTGKKDAVNENGEPEYQNVDTSFLVATLTAAIQEQQTIINDLKARIETLEGAK